MKFKNICSYLVITTLLFYSSALYAQNLTTLDNKIVEYSELVASPNTILFVWTTWCPYCRKELKKILTENIDFKSASLYLVNIGEKKAVVEKFLQSQKVPGNLKDKMIMDQSGIVADKFSISGIPVYIFLKNGQITHRSFYLNQEIVNSTLGE